MFITLASRHLHDFKMIAGRRGKAKVPLSTSECATFAHRKWHICTPPVGLSQPKSPTVARKQSEICCQTSPFSPSRGVKMLKFRSRWRENSTEKTHLIAHLSAPLFIDPMIQEIALPFVVFSKDLRGAISWRNMSQSPIQQISGIVCTNLRRTAVVSPKTRIFAHRYGAESQGNDTRKNHQHGLCGHGPRCGQALWLGCIEAGGPPSRKQTEWQFR